jgi:hypothetical protein
LIPLNITYSASPYKEIIEVSDEEDVEFVKAQFTAQRQTTTNLEARHTELQQQFADLVAENDRLRLEIKAKQHSQEQLELLVNYRESERDQLKQTADRLQEKYTRTCTKLKDLEDLNRELEVASRVYKQNDLTQATIEWADKIKCTLSEADQALHFYNALKFNYRLLKETEHSLAEANLQIAQMKTEHSNFKQQELVKAAERRPCEQLQSLKRPRPNDDWLVDDEDLLGRLAPPKKRPLSLLR